MTPTAREPAPREDDAAPARPELDVRLDRVLRVFVRLSAVCLALGLATALAWPGALPPRILLHAGLILLLASPAARLVVIVVVHTQKRRWSTVTMAVVTLMILMGSLAAGLLALWRG